MLWSNEDKSWRELAIGVGQQTNIDKLRIEDTQSYKEWTYEQFKEILALLQFSSTLITSQTRTNSYQHSWKFEPVQSWWESRELMRVDESWRSNASESCNSHQLSSLFDRAFIQYRLKNPQLKYSIQAVVFKSMKGTKLTELTTVRPLRRLRLTSYSSFNFRDLGFTFLKAKWLKFSLQIYDGAHWLDTAHYKNLAF